VDRTVREVMYKLIGHLNEWSERAAALPLRTMNRHYQNHMFRYGQISRFTSESGDLVEGMIKGIDETGRLLLQTEQGVQAFHQGHLRYTDL
jgi:biotin-(acetyl-CoA carboxylase) ligase